MTTQASSDNLLLGSGKLYFALREAGVLTGEQEFGNVSSFTISTEDEKKEKTESMTPARATYKEALVKRTVTLKITGDEFSPENLALQTMGKLGTLTQTAGTVESETVTAAAKPGRFYKLANRKVSNVVVKVGASTKVEGTDYVVDYAVGRIKILSTGTITDGATVTAGYSYASVTMQRISGGTVGNVEAFIRFIGDPAAGPAYECQVWRVSLTPDGELGFISDDFGNWSLTGKVLSDAGAHPDSPLYELIKLN